jgi:hypothetical protein
MSTSLRALHLQTEAILLAQNGRSIRHIGRPFSANPKGRMNFGHFRRRPSRPQLLLRSSPTALVLAEIPSGRMLPFEDEAL